MALFLDHVIRDALPASIVDNSEHLGIDSATTTMVGTAGYNEQISANISLCTNVIKLFALLVDKDIFLEHYTQYLRRRLLLTRSHSFVKHSFCATHYNSVEIVTFDYFCVWYHAD